MEHLTPASIKATFRVDFDLRRAPPNDDGFDKLYLLIRGELITGIGPSSLKLRMPTGSDARASATKGTVGSGDVFVPFPAGGSVVNAGSAAENPRNTVQYRIDPYRLGLLQGLSLNAGGELDFLDAMQDHFDAAVQAGALDRPIEIVRCVLPRSATVANVTNAWRELVEGEKTIAVVGSNAGDAAGALARLANDGRTPTILCGGADEFSGPFCISLSRGSKSDEAPLLVNHHLRQTRQNVVLAAPNTGAGRSMSHLFQSIAREQRLPVLGELNLQQNEVAVRRDLSHFHDQGADAIQLLACDHTHLAAVQALEFALAEFAPETPKVADSASTAVLGALQTEAREWLGLGQTDISNKTLRDALDSFERRHSRVGVEVEVAYGRDVAALLVSGLKTAKPLWREGLMQGLERVRWLKSAVGQPGTFISIGPFDHSGYKGPYIVLDHLLAGREALPPTPTILSE